MAKDYTRQENLDIIEREARERGIPRDDFLRFAYIETGGKFNELASRGPNGAKGLFQFVPDTARQYGIAGRELDPVANTDAAARLYLSNQKALVANHQRDGRDYLSGKPSPDGLDMYLAHQQGAGGYRSIQSAIATGHFSRNDTRGNLLNNISSRDVLSVTGHSMDDVRKMSDKQLAATFVQYWDVKFDRVQIAEKGIKPIVEGKPAQSGPQIQGQQTEGQTAAKPAATQPGQITLNSPYDNTIKYDHLKYGLGSRSVNGTKIDCSAWAGFLINNAMEEINREAGRPVFSTKDKAGGLTSEGIVDKFAKSSGQVLTGAQVTKANLKEGMIIGEDNGPQFKTENGRRVQWDAGRERGIDHITMVVKNPKTGELMISQSRGGEGVELVSIDKYLEYKQNKGVKLYATDPLEKGRDLLQEQSKTQGQQQKPSAPVQDGAINRQDSGAGVIHVQQMLNKLGYVGGNGQAFEAKTGNYGPNTEFAVKAFQQANGLKQTGEVDQATLKALKQAQEQPLITEANHPQRQLYAAIAKQLPPGTKPEAVANVTLQAMENGITDSSKLGKVSVKDGDAFVMPAGSFGGNWIKVDLSAPTASIKAMSDHMTQEAKIAQPDPQKQVAQQTESVR